MMLAKARKYLYRESGLESLSATGVDAWLIILSRSCRMFAYGSSSLVLALFFAELKISDSRIGLFMTLTLLGDVVLSLLLTLVADRVGRRRTVFGGSAMMVISGITFALCENYWVLLLAAVVGVISASGGDFGPFRAIEESALSELTAPDTRADVLVWYVMGASLGSSLGTTAAGHFVDRMRDREGWTLLRAYHACFWLYVIMGAINMVTCICLSKRVELQSLPSDIDAAEVNSVDDESALDKPRNSKPSYFASISKQTRSIMYALWALLMVDSLADGMVGMPLTTYYMDQKFHVPKSVLGGVLSASYVLASCSTIFAGPLARRIGLVSTMVFTHVPSSAAVLLFPLPSAAWPTFALLLVRVGLNNMDQAPRAAFIAAVVQPAERTAVMGITSMLRSLASATGPFVTGVLAESGRFWIAFVAAGALRLAYDFGLFAMFVRVKLHQHEPSQAEESGYALAEQREPIDEEESVGK